VCPNTSLFVPGHKAHFVLNFQKCYFGGACYFLPFSEADELYEKLKNIEKESLVSEYQCVLENLDALFKIYAKNNVEQN
jgi:hypothetical protein